jgi:N-acetyl-1-D-myo-inositol-2-amino-2-deoxy-alpha-D-glucopyranoside deacetylase
VIPSRRLLLLHAHPDDEVITTGATMAYYAAQGVGVTLVTCTLGEEGEILVPALTLLASDQADQLGGYRISELAAAMARLGVTDHRYLGGPGRFRDSGMMGTSTNNHPRAFWRADGDGAMFDAAVAAAVDVIREVRPQVVVTYDPNGQYGHPDHIMAHRVATAAVDAAADPAYDQVAREPWCVTKTYWTAAPRSVLRRQQAAMRAAGKPFLGVENVEDLPFGVEDDEVTTAVHAVGFGDAKMRALAAHATQVTVDGDFFALSNQLGREIESTEYFRLVRGVLGPDRGGDGWESDLFDGLTT